MAVTIKQIADAAGYSAPTVSQILNDKGSLFREETRDRVLKVARTLGYRPNAAAIATRTGCFNSIGMLQAAGKDLGGLEAAALRGVELELFESDRHLLISRLPEESLDNHEDLPRLLREMSVDGLLMNYVVNVPPAVVQLVHDMRIPCVWLNVALDTDAVLPDDFAAGLDATRHMISFGHRDIAYVGERAGVHYSTAERCNGYIQAMTDAGLTPRICPATGYHEDMPLMRDLLSNDDRPTAVVTVKTSYFVIAAWQCGLSIPGDLSVASIRPSGHFIGDLDVTSWLIPGLQLGQCGVKLLNEKIRKPENDLPSRRIPFDHRPGTSVAPRHN